MEQHTASAEECQELLNLINADETGTVTGQITAFHAARPSVDPQPDLDSAQWKSGIREVLETYKTRENTIKGAAPTGRVRMLKRISWAVAAALVLTAGAYYFLTIKENTPKNVEPAGLAQAPILPGKNGALLTLADGRQVLLDSAGEGLVAAQQGADAMLKNGELRYTAGNDKNGAPVFNTLSTPKGRQFQLQLPDGSKVWLNAGSSVRFPTVFTGNERKVDITGEVYFEVAANAKQPFKVMAGNRLQIDVLGTSFNVNAYANEEAVHTTLVDGSVKVSMAAATNSGKGASVVLKPGQQARAVEAASNSATAGILVNNNADIDKITAWKHGYFNFGNAGLKEVMRQLERWYDIEVVYEQGVPDIKFIGKMTRNITLQDLFQILESTGVNFRIEGKKVIVTK